MKLNDRFKEVREKLKKDKFLNGRGTGNDLSFYVFDYNPKYEIAIRHHKDEIIKEFNRIDSKYIKEYDLYKMFINFLKEQDVFEQVIDMERTDGKEYIFSAITPFINQNMYIKKIEEDFKDYKVIFITGVGKVYPFMRSHNILNSLHSVLGKKPLIMFYPGEYTGQDLTLFNKFMDDNYYRAFSITD
ncbi:DUF1788 domain-containing protein [Clostridium sporogenes]|uniref:DUF1788 domain-containing protein n=1 Tax=Clostridium sporogenes TaxID=1509 RepID=UPI002149B31F|nr:DUF1788 domain-containing protein [Clostridium sporogenes]MCR1973066.1 DUF1788 domain-containing protein [Clostridium sporogenes]